MRTRWIALALSVLALGLVAGCGGDDEDDGGDAAQTTEQPAPQTEETATEEAGTDTGAEGGGSTVQLSTAADAGLAYDTTELMAEAGQVTIEYENESDVPHNVTLEDPQEATETISSGSSSLTADLEPGAYTFFCSVAGHREAGMEGTIVVE